MVCAVLLALRLYLKMLLQDSTVVAVKDTKRKWVFFFSCLLPGTVLNLVFLVLLTVTRGTGKITILI